MITLGSLKVRQLLEEGLGLKPEIKEWAPIVRLLSNLSAEFGGDDEFCHPGYWADICVDLKHFGQMLLNCIENLLSNYHENLEDDLIHFKALNKHGAQCHNDGSPFRTTEGSILDANLQPLLSAGVNDD